MDRRQARRARRPARGGARGHSPHAGALLGGAALPEAEQAARAAVQAQPFRESARAALMEVLRARGNVNEALRVYEDIRVLLREELGSSPGAALVALHEQLLRDEPAPAPAAAPVAKPIPRSSTLVERDREVALLDGLLQEATLGEGRAVLIEGPPGIGKSRLLAEFRRRAVGRGRARAQRARGRARARVPVRRRAPAVRGRRHRPGRARRRRGGRARGVRARPRTARPPATRRFAALHGLYWLTLNLAAERPLLLEIDDLHWCDRPSLRFLAYLVRRLEGQPVLVTRQRAHRRRADRRRADGRDRQRSRHRPRPARAAVARRRSASSSRSRLGAEPDARLPRGLPRHDGRQPAARPPAAQRAGDRRRPPGRRARRRGARDRLARRVELGAAAARAAARRGRDRRPRGRRAGRGRGAADRRRRCPGLDEAQVAGAMAALARAEILRPEPPPGFVHPLVRDAVYTGLPLGERELLHARAAGVLRERGAPLDQVAGQLMHTPRRGDAEVARLLHEAGHAAMSRGAVDSSVGYLQRALEEPPAAPRIAPAAAARPRRGRRRSRAARTARVHLREAYDGPDRRRSCASAPRTRSGARCCSPPRPPRAPRVALRGRRARCRRSWPTRRSGCEAFALMGVPFGALRSGRDARRSDEWRGAAAGDHRREDDGRRAPRSSGR